jgi:hypothetical protein
MAASIGYAAIVGQGHRTTFDLGLETVVSGQELNREYRLCLVVNFCLS